VAVDVLLVAILVVLVWPRDVSSYEIGRSVGVALVSILIGYGIWSIVRRVRGSGAKWSPWVLAIALVVAAIYRVVPADEPDSSPSTGRPQPSAVASLTPEELFVDIPELRYRSVPRENLERAEAFYLSEPAAAEMMLGVDGRRVFEGEQQVGVITAVFSEPNAVEEPSFRAGLFDGFENSVEEQGGGPITSQEILGIEARGGRSSLGYAFTFILENAVLTVVGGDRATAELIAEGLIRGQA
jgi:hypothetical protein